MAECEEFPFEPVPEAGAAARHFITQTLQRWNRTEYLTDALIVGYELAVNAIQHARTPAVLRLLRTTPGVRIEVVDRAATQPQLEEHNDLGRPTGRGLRMVATVASDWGSRLIAGGKVVWAELEGPPPLGTTTEVSDRAG